MTSKILLKISNEFDDSEFKKFKSVPEYIESTLNDEKELYKYISLKDDYSFIKNIVKDNTIKFTSPDEFNDPFECMSVIGVTSLDATMKKLEELSKPSGSKYSEDALLRSYDNIVKHSLEYYRTKSLSKYGMLCLSGTWDNILMWAHYSNDHKGIILVFQFDENHYFYDKMMKVKYKKGITYFEVDHPNCGKKMWESFSTKDPIWEYENEYRIIHSPSEIHLHDGKGIKSFPRELLKGIIFGFRIDQAIREEIINTVKEFRPTLNLFDIVLDEEEVKLHKVPIHL